MDSVDLYKMSLEVKYFKIPDATLKTYDTDRDTVDRILMEQSWVCGICEQPFKKTPCIDHDHHTNRVRGLLCSRCNTGLGHFRDEVKILARAIVYLEKNSLDN